MSRRKTLLLRNIQKGMSCTGWDEKSRSFIFKRNADDVFSSIIPKNISERKRELWSKWFKGD